ncbi:ribosome small subunit-dependent GTPase A [Shewanella sp. AS1]|uniref:ribosome small subunit-dependent GTPase A n=1 Tax=Shewanella sp. AS1 TaxID=2907626 RepID=UPI001F2DF9E2|nr:ribosome small subunit-dependent GTPase A [Shewanella sp. AS1]MCE9678449.1 ribosome small subunit-dependent GTPase A [Shewanella sp. AS1]
MNSPISLQQLGWQPFFQQQISLEELEQQTLARVSAHHRNEYVLRSEQQTLSLVVSSATLGLTLGDWVLLDSTAQFVRRLDRKSLFSRKAPGSGISAQLIAANVDTVFIVCSLNDDFNLSRIERYLALAHEAEVTPVVVLTKADLCRDSESKIIAAQQLTPLLDVVAINALDPVSVEILKPWCRPGQTISLLGSSGVGKSSLVNSLLGEQQQKTAGIRQDDSKGRHTTTARSMHFLASGSVLIDTPGMRELQLADCETGVSQTFSDIEQLASQCKFSDCKHENEPGCVVRERIASAQLDERRLNNYLKLQAEQERNAIALHEARAKDKQFGKMVKNVGSFSRQLKRGE